MPTIVERLQQAALDPNATVSDLLRRVKFVAAKLGLGRVEDWVEQELNGYETSPPEYRRVRGRPMARNPVRGWMPVGGNTEQLSSTLSYEPVSALEALVTSSEAGARLHMAYPGEIQEALNRENRIRGWNFALELPPSEPRRILDRVRTLVLEWALNLERAGIVGTEDSFHGEDKQKAQAAGNTINIGQIGSFVGNLGHGNASGNISGSGINTEQLGSVIDQLRSHRDEIIKAGADGKKFEDGLAELEKALVNPQPDHSVLRGLLTDLRNCLSGAAGSLVATGATNVLNMMLGTGVPAS